MATDGFLCKYCGRILPWEEHDYKAGVKLAERIKTESNDRSEDVSPLLICKMCSEDAVEAV